MPGTTAEQVAPPIVQASDLVQPVTTAITLAGGATHDAIRLQLIFALYDCYAEPARGLDRVGATAEKRRIFGRAPAFVFSDAKLVLEVGQSRVGEQPGNDP